MRINLLFFLLFTATIFGQTNFHEGTILLKDNSKLEVTIDYGGWIKTPETITVKYKGEIRTYTPQNLSEFEIDGDRYIARPVNLDITEQDLQTLSGTIKQKSVKKELFLRVLVQGTVSLYSYKDTRTHYFTSKSDVKDLIELNNLRRLNNSKISYSKQYIGQLRLLLSDCLENSKIDKLQFSKSNLLSAVKEYNECSSGGSEYIVKKSPIRTDFFVLGGYKNSGYELPNTGRFGNYILDSESDGNFTVGLGLNINLLRNTERLQLYTELLYQQYGFSAAYREDRLPQQYADYNLDVDLSYMELSIMLRYHFIDNTKSLRPFLNAGAVNAFKLSDNSTETVNLVFFDTERLRELEPLDGQISSHRLFIVVGAGLEYNRFTFEFRYGFNPEISEYPVIVRSDIINLILGIRLF